MMTGTIDRPATAFHGDRHLASGPLVDVALAVKAAERGDRPILVFDDATGRIIDLDLRGGADDIAARLAPPSPGKARGRPKLGVLAREITLLPRHWDWLATQPGGASQALRRLVDDARRTDAGETGRKAARERCYRVLSAIAGDLPGFEEAARALFAGDGDGFARQMAGWPQDIARYALRLAEVDAAAIAHDPA